MEHVEIVFEILTSSKINMDAVLQHIYVYFPLENFPCRKLSQTGFLL